MLEILFIPLIIIIIYITYQIPIAIIGIKKVSKSPPAADTSFPFISIIIPTRNEELVIERCLSALLNQDYPRNKYEIIIVDGASTDNTITICERYRKKHPRMIKLICEEDPNGKPAALNTALKHAVGDIIGVFDADNIPQKNVLLKVSRYFHANPDIAAIQGRVKTINSEQNILTKLISIEEAGWFRLMLRGRDKLNLFVPLTGSCLFIKKEILSKVGGWKADELAEDIELSIRLLKNGYDVKYVDDIISWQEAPPKIRAFITQRSRWYRGYIENAIKNGGMLRKLNRKVLDAEMLLIGPIIMLISLLSYILSIYGALHQELQKYSYILAISINTLVLIAVIIILIVNKPRNLANILVACSIWVFWLLESFIALRAFIEMITRRRPKWMKTPKYGYVTVNRLGAYGKMQLMDHNG